VGFQRYLSLLSGICGSRLLESLLPSGFLSTFNPMPLCQPSASRALVLEYLYEAGDAGLLPKDLAARLAEFKVRRHQVSRRILRMNKRFGKEIGEKLVEKRGWHWALTCFAFQSWGNSEIDRQVSEISGDARE